MTVELHRLVGHRRKKYCIKFHGYWVKDDKHTEVKHRHLCKQAKEGPKDIFQGSSPQF